MSNITISNLTPSLDSESLITDLTEQETWGIVGGDHYYVIVDNNGNPVGVIHVKD